MRKTAYIIIIWLTTYILSYGYKMYKRPRPVASSLTLDSLLGKIDAVLVTWGFNEAN